MCCGAHAAERHTGYRIQAKNTKHRRLENLLQLELVRSGFHGEKNGSCFRAVSSIESNERAGGRLIGEMLENGHGSVAPRPYKQKVIDKALPKVKAIYKKPYKGG